MILTIVRKGIYFHNLGTVTFQSLTSTEIKKNMSFLKNFFLTFLEFVL